MFPTLSFLIDNSATAKRLRCGLPRFGLRISPLALQCTQPRTLSLLPQLRASSRRGASTPGCRGRAPQYCQLSMRVRNTNRRKDHAAGRSLVIPRSNIPPLNQPLGTRCFVHGNTHGRFPETGRPEPTAICHAHRRFMRWLRRAPRIKGASAGRSFPCFGEAAADGGARLPADGSAGTPTAALRNQLRAF